MVLGKIILEREKRQLFFVQHAYFTPFQDILIRTLEEMSLYQNEIRSFGKPEKLQRVSGKEGKFMLIDHHLES
jgi:hypothetical protein